MSGSRVDVVQGQKRIALFMPLEGDYSDVALVAACGVGGNCAPEAGVSGFIVRKL